MNAAPAEFFLQRLDYETLEGWEDDDPSGLFVSMRDCREHLLKGKPYRSGSLGLTSEDLMPLLEAAASIAPRDAAEARSFFEAQCIPFAIRLKAPATGFVTGFYEPELEVSPSRTSEYRYPFYRRPDDLVDLDQSNRPADIDVSYAYGRRDSDGISLYPDRKSIDQGYLEGRGLEIAWAKSKIDVFFVHVQGAARLIFPDGTRQRITFAAKAGHPFSPIGRLLVERGEIPPETVSMQSIRAWLRDHPAQADEVLWHNRSYIFFSSYPESDPSLGPVAAAKVPLRAGRSLAVDRTIHSFGFPFFVRAAGLTHLDKGKPFQRLMLALDTGSAILGPARGDIFTGSGIEAGEAAGTIRHRADFVLLVPHAAARRFL